MELKGAAAIITGGASGLGEATLRRFVQHGARAVILDINAARGQAIAAELGDAVRFAQADVASEQQVQAAVDLAVEVFGGVQILVNCGGSSPGLDAHRTVSRERPHPLEDFETTIRSYLTGTFNCIRLAAFAMGRSTPNAEGERGVIINTASVSATDGQIGQVAYTAAKAGVAGMTLVIARDLAVMGIRNVTISPGFFLTPRGAAEPEELRSKLVASAPFPNRPGKPDEYARMAQAIVENPMLNGEVIRLDGAMRLQPR